MSRDNGDGPKMPRVVISRPWHGLARMQVCAVKGVSDAEVLAFCNAKNPSGTEHGWVRVIREGPPEKGGPVQCADHANREHLLVEC